METLYRMYRDGDGVEKDETKALEWLTKASEKGIAAALAALGDCYEYGCLGVQIDMDKAVPLYQKAADNKDAMGLYCIGLCFKEGKGVPQSDKEALICLTRAAYEDDDDLHYDDKALVALDELYYGGEGFTVNERRFNGYDTDVNQKALLKLYLRYKRARGLPKNIDRALECLKAAAEHGGKVAQNELGWMYYTGELVERNSQKAFEWTMKAVNNGHPSGMETLFRMYRDGDGVAKNEQQALKWLEVASRNPDECGVAASELGECYEYGLLGLKKDSSKAFELYYRASQKNKCPGKFNRGRCHLYGIGTAVDVPRAIEWLSKAAEKEDSDDHKYDLLAMALLEKLYSEGTLVEKDDAKVQMWQAKLDEVKKQRQEEIPGFVSPV